MVSIVGNQNSPTTLTIKANRERTLLGEYRWEAPPLELELEVEEALCV